MKVFKDLTAINQLGPFISIDVRLRKYLFLWKLENLEWNDDLKKILVQYNKEVMMFIQTLWQKIIYDADNHDFDISDIVQKEQVWQMKESDWKDYDFSFISHLEKRNAKGDIRRPMIQFNIEKDYSYKLGWSTSYRVPDIKARDIIISDYLYRKVEAEILFFLESSRENEYYKIKKSKVDQIEKDEMMFQTDNFDLSSLCQSKQLMNETSYRKS